MISYPALDPPRPYKILFYFFCNVYICLAFCSLITPLTLVGKKDVKTDQGKIYYLCIVSGGACRNVLHICCGNIQTHMYMHTYVFQYVSIDIFSVYL